MAVSSRVCPSCSTSLDDDALFCSRCGASTPTGISRQTGLVEPSGTGGAVAPVQRERLQRALGDGYEVRDLLGSGGFAEVYAALDRRLKRPVAVKVLRADLVLSPAQLQRFQREAEAVANLRHPCIVPIYAVGEAEGLAYYVMPLVQGESLRARLERDGALAIPETVRILKELAGALAAAHRVGIVHRDLKPDNVMLEGEERRVLLMDFGIAKALGAAEGGLTGTGMIIGTPHYMSPEQASGEKEIDHRSDIYSLGVLAWQMLAGHLPFEGDSAQMVLMKQITTPAERVDEVRKDTPAELAEAVERCLVKRPADRWASAGDLLASLDGVATGLATPTAARRAPPRRAGRWRFRPWPALAAAALIVAAYTAAFKRHVLWSAADFWFGLTGEQAAEVQSSASSERWNRGWGFPVPVNRLVSIGDSLLVLLAPAERNTFLGLSLFDGRNWRSLPTSSGRLAVAASSTSGPLWLFEADTRFGDGPGASFRLERGRLLRGDSVPFAVRSAWAAGGQVVLGGSSGEVAALSSDGWRREPTGTRASVVQFFGLSRDDLYAIAGFAGAGRPDSLLHFNGFSWQTMDVRADTTSLWIYNAGVALADGSHFVVGVSVDSPEDMERVRPLVAARDTGGLWREATVQLPRDFQPTGVFGRSRSELFVWGFDDNGNCRDRSVCAFEINGDSVTPIAAFAGFVVAGVGMIRGRPYALLEDGTLWAENRGVWGVVGEAPHSRVYVDASDDSTAVTAGDGVFSSLQYGELTISSEESFVRAAVRRPSVWLLTAEGRVYEHRCRSLPRVDCQTRALPSPVGRTPSDVGALPDGRLFVVGPGGLFASWRGGGWVSEALPAAVRGEDFIRISASHDRPTAVLGNRSILLMDSTGTWKVAAAIPAWFGAWRELAVFPNGSIAVAGNALGVWSASGGEEVRSVPFYYAPAESIRRLLALSDGRLVAATAEPGDPLLGGFLMVSTPLPDSAADGGWRPGWRAIEALPPRVDVYGLSQQGARLHVVGSGWFHYATGIANLVPAADSLRRN